MSLRTVGALTAALAAVVLHAASANANPLEDAKFYGSFAHFESVPYALFLLGEIEDGDFFELRQAMRERDIQIVVTASPGGSVFEALQIASVINDNKISTYVPRNQGLSCASACAFVFFAGTNRVASGRLGVHQFSTASGSELDRTSGNIASRVAQYTTGEIIAFLNEFNTPPAVYAKMFSTPDMYWFNENERNELTLGVDDTIFTSRQMEIDAFADEIVDFVTEMEQAPSSDEALADTAPAQIPDQPFKPQPSSEPQSFSISYDVDLFGNDILANGLREVSLSRCQEVCHLSDECRAYTYIPATRWCWPKFAVGNLSYRADAVTGIKQGDGIIPAEPVQTGYSEFTSKDITGFDLLPDGMRGLSLNGCRAACTARSDCAGFTWVRDRHWCWLKSFAGHMTDRLGMVSGIKN